MGVITGVFNSGVLKVPPKDTPHPCLHPRNVAIRVGPASKSREDGEKGAK